MQYNWNKLFEDIFNDKLKDSDFDYTSHSRVSSLTPNIPTSEYEFCVILSFYGTYFDIEHKDAVKNTLIKTRNQIDYIVNSSSFFSDCSEIYLIGCYDDELQLYLSDIVCEIDDKNNSQSFRLTANFMFGFNRKTENIMKFYDTLIRLSVHQQQRQNRQLC